MTCGTNLPFAIPINKQDAPLKFGAPWKFADIFGTNGIQYRGRRRLRLTHENQQGLTYKLVESHHDRYGIPRQPEIMCIAHLAISQRTARLHGNLPENDLPQLFQQLFHVVRFTYRYPAAGNNDIGFAGSFEQCVLEDLRVITDYT